MIIILLIIIKKRNYSSPKELQKKRLLCKIYTICYINNSLTPHKHMPQKNYSVVKTLVNNLNNYHHYY